MNEITGRPTLTTNYGPLKHRNGQPPPGPLPENIAHNLAGTLAHYATIEAERDAAIKENAEVKAENSALKAANMMMESAKNASESRVVSYQQERDQAVSELAELRGKHETIFESLRAVLSLAPPAVTEVNGPHHEG